MMMDVARILLPGRLSDGSLLRWSDIAVVTGYPSIVDGYTPWAELVELRPEHEAEMLPSAAAGWVDRATGRALVRGMGPLEDAAWTWAPSAQWDQAHVSAIVRHGDPLVRGTLEELVDEWDTTGFSGRAWTREVVLEAPRYADSVIITAERSVVDALMREGLEVHRVSRARDVPIWCD